MMEKRCVEVCGNCELRMKTGGTIIAAAKNEVGDFSDVVKGMCRQLCPDGVRVTLDPNSESPEHMSVQDVGELKRELKTAMVEGVREDLVIGT